MFEKYRRQYSFTANCQQKTSNGRKLGIGILYKNYLGFYKYLVYDL